LPAPARAAIETNAGNEWHRREGEAAMMESAKAGEREPIEARCKSWPEREVAGPDEPTAGTGAAKAPAAEAPAHHRTAKATTDAPAAEASTYHRTAKATADAPAVEAPAVEAATVEAAVLEAPAAAHPGIRSR
jgi:hypothetical protein